MVAPGQFTEVVTLSIIHPLLASDEPLSLNASSPAGITVSFTPSSPVQVPASKSLNVSMDIVASKTATVGNGTIKIQAGSGPNAQTATFTLRVVQYRVVMIHNTFNPVDMNVTAGSAVYWQNLDGPAAGCGASTVGTGAHSVVFTTIPGANSSSIPQFGIYSYTFNTPGSYFYYSSLDSDHVMNGTVTVTAAGGGGAGMVPRMPAFSYFKGGTPAVVTPTTPTTRASSANPIAAIAAASPVFAGGLALAAFLMLGVGSPTSSGLWVGAGLAFLLSLVALALALAISTQARRKMTALGLSVITWAHHSDSQQALRGRPRNR